MATYVYLCHQCITLVASVNSVNLTHQLALKAAVLCAITRNDGHWAVQGHSRSPISVPIESPYATPTSYLWTILTYVVSCSVSELSHAANWSNSWFWQGVPQFNSVVRGKPVNSGGLLDSKLETWYIKPLSDVDHHQCDRRTDRLAIATARVLRRGSALDCRWKEKSRSTTRRLEG